MGIDLNLLPFDGDWPNLAFSHTVLVCERHQDLFDVLVELPGEHVPKGFSSRLGRGPDGETTYGETQETPYGEPLLWVTASQLVAWSPHPGVQGNWRNRAIWAYLAHIPPQTKVALYWC